MKQPEWLNTAIDLYTNQHKSFKDIGIILNVGRKTVGKYLNKAGYKSNPKYSRKIDPNIFRKYDYSICDHVFDKIDNEEKAYWLGFLYADGYVSELNSTIELSLEEKDLSHLEKFRSFLGLENKPFNKKEKNINGQIFYSYRLGFNSNEVKNALIKLGCKPNKTFILEFPTNKQVPQNLIHHFIRGYIDGDGCIYVSNNRISVEVLGTEKFLLGYKKWVNLGTSRIYNFNHSNIKRVVNSNKQALDILDRIYQNASIYLQRKYDKYINFRRLRPTSQEDLK